MKNIKPIHVISISVILLTTLTVLIILLMQKEEEVAQEFDTERETTVSRPTDVRIDTSESRSKDLDSDLSTYLSQKSEGEKIELEMFDGEILDCEIESITQESEDIQNITCSSERFLAFFTYDGEKILGTIDDYDKTDGSYVVRTTLEDGRIVLEEHSF